MRTGQLYLSRRRRARARGRGFCDPAIRLLVMGNPITLSVDCGGGGIKASVLDAAGTMIAQPVRTSTPYPLPPELLIKVICDLAADLPAADRVTVGMPGMIRHGVVIATPHYVTKAGPRTKALPDLVEEWSGIDMRRHLSRALDRPVMVLNDAEVHGAGAIAGSGLERIFTRGTGLGNALFDGGRLALRPQHTLSPAAGLATAVVADGRLAPDQELGQGGGRWGLAYDDGVGEAERVRRGDGSGPRRIRPGSPK